MIGNNSCGVHSLIGLGTGRTSDQVHELESCSTTAPG